MATDFIGGEMGEVVVRLVVLAAAFHLALIEFADMNVLTDTLALAPDEVTLVMAGVATAAGIASINLARWQGWVDE